MARVAPGIYKDQHGLRAIVAIAAGRKEKRFPRGTSLKIIKRWRNQMIVKLETLHPQKRAGAIGRWTFRADVKRYLSRLSISSWASRRSELRAWEQRLPEKIRRSAITDDHVRAAIKAWTEDGTAPKTIRNRLMALATLYRTLDGPHAWTPTLDVPRPKVVKRRPLYVPVETLQAVEVALRAGDPKTHARYMVLIATGARPVFLKRTTAGDVDLERRSWNIPAAKDGNPIQMYLNDDMVAAWQVFIKADAWGDFKSEEYAKQLRAAGWPADVRPYNAKHAFGQDLADRGFGRESIADWYGHTKAETTKIYTGTAPLKPMSEAMNGRLGWGTSKRLAVDVGTDSKKDRIALLKQMLEEAIDALS